jgi:hypothetical protein
MKSSRGTDSRVTSGTVFSVDGHPSALEGEPPIAKQGGNLTWTRWRSFGGN